MSTFEYILRDILWWLINMDMLFIGLLVIGFICLFFKRNKWGRHLLYGTCTAIIFVGTVPLGFWVIENLENRFPKPTSLPSGTKGIILLGGNFDGMSSVGRGETVHNMAAGRLIDFIKLANAYPNLPIVFAGGGRPIRFNKGAHLSEAELMQRELKALKFDTSRITFEDKSINTIENAQLSYELVNPKPSEKWALVTSAFHMPRSVGLFRKAGWNVIPYPVDYHTPGQYEPYFFLGLYNGFFTMHYAVWEWCAMTQNYLFGRSDELYPGPHTSPS